MNKFKNQSRGNRTGSAFKENQTSSKYNPYHDKVQLIKSMIVVHPLIDRLIQTKMAKCLQHGHFYSRPSTQRDKIRGNKVVEAPTISGSLKMLEKRPPPSRMKIDWTGMKTARGSSRPKTSNTIIRSRTSEPRITRKLELISKQQVLDQEQDHELKPSFAPNKVIRKSIINVTSTQKLDQ